ncbi:type VII secretion target [Actinokineospora sp.]|uniref:type VII secretion target n=1 Tax=Actinokineospora sp. TaxID=1872133 RepID=UPI004037A1A7
MPEGYGVLIDELGAHAGRLDALNDKLDTALLAARQAHLGDQAYGVVCQFFVPMVRAVSEPGVAVIGKAAETVDATATGVRDTARAYGDTEQTNTKPFTGGPR